MLNSIKIPIYGEKPEGGYYFQIYFIFVTAKRLNTKF